MAVRLLVFGGWLPFRKRRASGRLANDQAYELVMAVASAELDDLDVIADRLRLGQ